MNRKQNEYIHQNKVQSFKDYFCILPPILPLIQYFLLTKKMYIVDIY